MSALDVLKEARAHLGKGPQYWCRGTYFRRIDTVDRMWIGGILGSELASLEGNYAACAAGAMWGCEISHDQQDILAGFPYLERALPVAFGVGSISDFNDAPTTTYDDVLALFDNAIAQLEPSI